VTVPREEKVGCIALPSHVESCCFESREKVELGYPSIEAGGLKLLNEIGVSFPHPRERLPHGGTRWRIPSSLGHDLEPLVQAVIWHDGVEEIGHTLVCSALAGESERIAPSVDCASESMERMLTVYLDQAKWINLSAARVGRVDGARFAPALDVARQALGMGLVEFPLSTGHYIETWRASDPERRRRLAETMIELSQGRTLAKPPDLCDNELDLVVSRFSERPSPRTPWPPLGWGFPHASGTISETHRAQVNLEHEVQHLAQRPAGYLAHGGGHRDFADLYREGEEGLLAGDKIRDQPRAVQEAIVAVSAVMEIHENIAWALERAHLPPDSLGPISLARPDLPADQRAKMLGDLMPVARAFIEELPTRAAVLRLRLLRHQNPKANWESNDMVDIAYLGCAVVHCDLVVTEKQWVHELKRSGLLEQHGTRVMHNLAELPSVLADLVG
jgi:hypothetical protein